MRLQSRSSAGMPRLFSSGVPLRDQRAERHDAVTPCSKHRQEMTESLGRAPTPRATIMQHDD
jgi:hypothetical protein